MVRKTYTPGQIINKLREAEVLLSQGSSIGDKASVRLKSTIPPQALGTSARYLPSILTKP